MKKATGQKTPVKQVRRNLFTESEEGDENNSSARVPRRRKLPESGGNNEQAKRRWHRRNTVGRYIKLYNYAARIISLLVYEPLHVCVGSDDNENS